MKYAIPFTRKFKHWDSPDIEIDINYKPKIKQLDTFINQFQNHRINLYLYDLKNLDKDLQIILALRDKHPNCDLVSCFPMYKKELEQKLNTIQLPHFYNEIVTTWDKFNGFLSLNVTDIIVGEEIAFSPIILSNGAKKNHKSLRFYANVCQSSWDDERSLTSFFVRPEDIDLYAPYFDVCLFYNKLEDKHKLNVLYETYAIDKKWYGRLKDIIVGYQGEEDGRFLLPEFGTRRITCNKRCNKTIQNQCSFCYTIAKTNNLLERKGYVIRN